MKRPFVAVYVLRFTVMVTVCASIVCTVHFVVTTGVSLTCCCVRDFYEGHTCMQPCVGSHVYVMKDPTRNTLK
jgi:hypothetical protein